MRPDIAAGPDRDGTDPAPTGTGGNPALGGKPIVFINCPYDRPYMPYFAAIAFTAYCCKTQPVCALTDMRGTAGRLDNIKNRIAASDFSIHELSPPSVFRQGLSIALNPEKQPRHNMAFELGLTLGATYWGGPVQQKHKALLLARNGSDVRRALSDLNLLDPQIHDGKIEILIEKVYMFLNERRGPGTTGPADIIRKFRKFQDETPEIARKMIWEPARFNIIECHDDYMVAMVDRIDAGS